MPLFEGDRVVGARLAAQPLSRRLRPLRQIGVGLLIASVIAIVLGAGLIFLIARRAMRPVKALVTATEAATAGEYDHDLRSDRRDEVGRLSNAFSKLVDELKEKHDMERYVAQLQRNLPDVETTSTTTGSPVERLDGAVLTLDFRRHGAVVSDPGRALGTLSRDLRNAKDIARSLRGRILGCAGHRVWIGYAGLQCVSRAVGTVADLRSMMTTAGAKSHELPLAVITYGAVAVGRSPETTIDTNLFSGRPIAALESLSREALPGEILIDDPAAQQLAEETSEEPIKLIEGRGLTTPIRFYRLVDETVDRLADELDRRAEVSKPQAQLTVDLQPGSVIAQRYEILGEIGSGGMGVVYKARDREIDDVIALKVLRPSYWRDGQTIDGIRQELKLARLVTHPNVIRVYDLGEFRGAPFLSMEYVRGVTLRRLLDGSERIPLGAAMRIARQICQGVGAIHAAGVVHCDFKPENVILDPTGNARVMDFGISQPERTASRPSISGSLRGTPKYLAPEQLDGETTDVRTDIYSCGMVLYELFTGHYAYTEHTQMRDVLLNIKDSAPTPPSQHWDKIPPALEAILLRCLHKDPAERFQSIEEVWTALQQVSSRRVA